MYFKFVAIASYTNIACILRFHHHAKLGIQSIAASYDVPARDVQEMRSQHLIQVRQLESIHISPKVSSILICAVDTGICCIRWAWKSFNMMKMLSLLFRTCCVENGNNLLVDSVLPKELWFFVYTINLMLPISQSVRLGLIRFIILTFLLNIRISSIRVYSLFVNCANAH